jgi:hypothetical protein
MGLTFIKSLFHFLIGLKFSCMYKIRQTHILFIFCIIFLSGCTSNKLEPTEPGAVWIGFSIPNKSDVSLKIKNRYKTNVRTFDFEDSLPGFYRIQWDLKTDEGNYVMEGIYFVFIYVNNELIHPQRKLTLLNP